MTHYIGVDLAWGEGTATRTANESGLALIDDTGRVLHAGWVRGIAAVADWIAETAGPGSVLAIDAPLVIHNQSGMRLCERQTGMGYGRWKVSANASNTVMGWQGGVALRNRLEEIGFRYSDGITPPNPLDRTFVECYPFTTIVGMEELGYEDERPRYKRLDKALTSTLGRQGRAAACDELIRRMIGLATANPPLDILSHEVSRMLVDEPSPIDNIPYKHREDMLDALLCAWTAAIWHQHGDTRVQILGRDDTTDDRGRRATIVAPARVEQRVAGRTMKVTRAASPAVSPPDTSAYDAAAASLLMRMTAQALSDVGKGAATESSEFRVAWDELALQLDRLSD